MTSTTGMEIHPVTTRTRINSRLVPNIRIEVSLTSHVYNRSSPSSDRPRVVVTTTVVAPSVFTVETRSEKDSGTILDDSFRAENFQFYDLTTSELVTHDLFPGTCDPWNVLDSTLVMELSAYKPNITQRIISHKNPLSEPVSLLKTGHRYRLTLKPQKIRCWDKSVASLFGGKDFLHEDEIPKAMEVLLACEDQLLLEIQE